MPQLRDASAIGVVGAIDTIKAPGLAVERITIGGKPVKVVNDDFVRNIDVRAVVEAADTRKKLLVVGQFPAAGELVPAGTPVKLMMMYKEAIGVGSFKGISKELKAIYADKKVADVIDDIERSTVTKGVFETGKDYDALNADEKTVFEKYAREMKIIPSGAGDESKKKVYNDLRYMYNF